MCLCTFHQPCSLILRMNSQVNTCEKFTCSDVQANLAHPTTEISQCHHRRAVRKLQGIRLHASASDPDTVIESVIPYALHGSITTGQSLCTIVLLPPMHRAILPVSSTNTRLRQSPNNGTNGTRQWVFRVNRQVQTSCTMKSHRCSARSCRASAYVCTPPSTPTMKTHSEKMNHRLCL